MIVNDLQWKIGGPAGFGIMTTGQLFALACAHGGLKTFAYPEYPSLIRGGHNTFQIVVSEEQPTAQRQVVQLLVALNKETFDLHFEELSDGTALIYDPADFLEPPHTAGKKLLLVPVEFGKIIKDEQAQPIERNTVALGASFGLLQYPWDLVEQTLNKWFGSKKPKLAESNIKLAKLGYEAAAKFAAEFTYRLQAVSDAGADAKINPLMVISGNAAICLGALQAGLKFYAAYPMTPSSSILSYLAKQEKKMNLVVKHTEDEISAINMAIGAGFAGARAMTATSGGGFSLMVEALGMAGISEVPVVIVMGQRPGPSTGLPTWGSQGDLRFVLHASQGEFPRIVLAPGDVTECFEAAFTAFNLAEIYQLPVIILVDKYNQESWQSAAPFASDNLRIDRGKLLSQRELDELVAREGSYLRHKYTGDGVSPRVLPGMAGGKHIASSYEHDEFGATTEDEGEATKQNDKRFQKLSTYLAKHARGPKLYGSSDAIVTVVGWGSTKLPALAAVKLAEKEGLKLNYLHFIYLDPLPVAAVRDALMATNKTLCVEGNKLGQFEGLLYEHTSHKMSAHLRKYGGRPFYPEEIVAAAKKFL